MANPEAPRSPDGRPRATRSSPTPGPRRHGRRRRPRCRPEPARRLRRPRRATAPSARHRRPRRRAASAAPRRARPRPAPATVTLGSNYSDAGPQAAMQAARRLVHRRRPASPSRSTRSTTARSRTRSAPICRARRTTSSRGSPGSGCGSSPRRACATDISDVWAKIGSNYSDALQGRLDRRRRQAVLRPDLQLPVGRLLPEERLRRKGLHDPEDCDDFKTLATKIKADGLDPVRVRRQGRLARDGHVRHPQHAAERLRVPRRPDGRQGEVDRPEGQGGLRHVEGAAAVPPGRRRSAGRGRTRHRRWSRRRPAMYFLGTFASQQSRRPARPTSTTSTSSPSRPSGPSTTPRRRSTPRSTASC